MKSIKFCYISVIRSCAGMAYPKVISFCSHSSSQLVSYQCVCLSLGPESF